jgi:hypothetical protein
MSASKSTSLMRDFTSLPEFDLMVYVMIEVFKIINDIYDPLTTVDMFELNTTSNTRGHSKKMKIKTSRLNVRKYTFVVKIVETYPLLLEDHKYHLLF